MRDYRARGLYYIIYLNRQYILFKLLQLILNYYIKININER